MNAYFQNGMYPGMPQQMAPMPFMGPNMPNPAFVPPNAIPHAERPMQAPVVDLPKEKEALGERLYPLVEMRNPVNASKITGMLLEMEVEQIHNILRDPTQLDKWISEAMKVINLYFISW